MGKDKIKYPFKRPAKINTEMRTLSHEGISAEYEHIWLVDPETGVEYTTTLLDEQNLKRFALAWKAKTGRATDYLEKILAEIAP